MNKKKSSWSYEKERNSKQIRLVFNLDDPAEALSYHYLERCNNKSGFIKSLIYDEVVRSAYEQA